MKKGFLKSKTSIIIFSIVIFILGIFIGKFETNLGTEKSVNAIKRGIAEKVAISLDFDARRLVLMENPSLISKIKEGASFGNEDFSVSAAQNMFGKDQEAIDDIISKAKIENISDNVWLIRLPIVNCSVIETEDGLIIIDTGMKPAGPAILKLIRSVSQKDIHTIIYTHGHVDHAYGTWALVDSLNPPQIIAHENLLLRNQRYINLRGSLAKYMSQPKEQLPRDSADLVWPTMTFQDDIELKIGGISLYLKHFEAETDDQLLVWLPDQQMLFAADYYQGFMPNAGNGKRIQRNVAEWIEALRFMASLNSKTMIPSHGNPVFGDMAVKDALLIHAENLQYIHDYVVNALNQGLRKDLIIDQFVLPEYLATHPLLNQKYVTAKDICKMVIKQFTGWWDDIPSHWSPARIESQATSIVSLAGGMDNLIVHIKTLIPQNLELAAHFVDWAYFADPENSEVHELVLEIYKKRILHKNSATQEMLVYLDHMAEVRSKM